MENNIEWREKEYKDLVNAAHSEPKAASELSAFHKLVTKGKRPIIERRIVGRHTIEYRVRDRDA